MAYSSHYWDAGGKQVVCVEAGRMCYKNTCPEDVLKVRFKYLSGICQALALMNKMKSLALEVETVRILRKCEPRAFDATVGDLGRPGNITQSLRTVGERCGLSFEGGGNL